LVSGFAESLRAVALGAAGADEADGVAVAVGVEVLVGAVAPAVWSGCAAVVEVSLVASPMPSPRRNARPRPTSHGHSGRGIWNDDRGCP
jgi:hypothetical protein